MSAMYKIRFFVMAASALFIAATVFAEPMRSEPVSRERMTNADFPTQLRPEPDSLQSIAKIPPATPVTISDMRVIQTDRFKENWYRVDYDGKTGWVRGDDLDGEKAEKSFSATYYAPDLPGPSSPGGVSF